MTKVLEDIRVLDLTHVWFGPFCTMMLADLGAEVIRTEPPWGAIDRIAEGALFGGVSFTFHHLNLNKKDITLNLKTPEGIEIFKELVVRSDVVVQNFSPGTMERLGLGYKVLKELNPGIIYAALSGFGQYGPYATRGSYASIAEAMSGHLRLTGDRADPEGPPLDIAQAYGDLGPALFAAMSIIAAIRYRDKTGAGQIIDVSQLDCMVALNTAVTGYTLSGLKPWELREKYPMGRGRASGLMKTKDGAWIKLTAYAPSHMDRLTRHMGEEIDKEMVERKVAEMTQKEAVEYFVSIDVPVAPVYHVNEVVRDPHLIARGMLVDLEHPKAGKVTVPNFPVKFSETPIKIKSAAPLLGQDNKEVLMGILGYTEERLKELDRMGIIYTER